MVYQPGRISEALKGSHDHRRWDSMIHHREVIERRGRQTVGTLEGPPGNRQDRGGRGERPGTRSDDPPVMRSSAQVALPRQGQQSGELHESTSVAGQQILPEYSEGTSHRMPTTIAPRTARFWGRWNPEASGDRPRERPSGRSLTSKNPRKVGYEPLFGYRSRATARRTRRRHRRPRRRR